MLGVLLKKQLLETFRGFFVSQKKGKAKSKLAVVISFALYSLLMVVVIGGMFAMLAFSLCETMYQIGLGWFYFALMSLMAILFGVFGSVFNTYAGLYKAKDNELLLSLPIPVRIIMASRLLSVYLMGLMFSGAVMVPAVVVACIEMPVSVGLVAGGIWLTFVISVFVLILSCALGWVVAKISGKLKNKSLITVLASLAFFVLYYYFYFRASEILQGILKNAAALGESIRGSAYPIYLVGRIGEGSLSAALIVTAAVFLMLALVWVIMERSFLKMATSDGSTGRIAYRERAVKRKSQDAAALGKEFGRFLASPNYILNCSLGTLFMVAAGVAVLLKGQMLRQVLMEVFGENPDFVSVLAAAAVCTFCTMNDMVVPSVSLEGKSLWIYQSMPISAWQVLKAKMNLQLIMTMGPALFLCICLLIALQTAPLTAVLLLLTTMVFVVFSDAMGMWLGVLRPNLHWTNELYPIKQSLNVLIVLFSGTIYAIAMLGLFLWQGFKIGVTLYLTVFLVLTAAATAGLLIWLKNKGAKIFAHL